MQVLDAALDVVDMRYAKELPFDLEGPGAQRKQQLLVRRAELGVRIRARLSADASLLFTGEWIWLPLQPTLAAYQATAGLRWRFTEQLALSVTSQYANAGLEGQLGMYIYY